MTTQLCNVSFSSEVNAYPLPAADLPAERIILALADIVRAGQGRAWVTDMRVLSLLHSINKCVHGDDYHITGAKQQRRLEKAFEAISIKTTNPAAPL